MKATELIETMRNDFAVIKHSFHFFFGYVQAYDKSGNNWGRGQPQPPKRKRSVVDSTEERRNFNLG